METKAFSKLLKDYKESNIEEKIDLYCSTNDLSEEQYMILLKNFPMNQIKKLEYALAE